MKDKETAWTDQLFNLTNKDLCECENCMDCHDAHIEDMKISLNCDLCTEEWCDACGWSGYDAEDNECRNPKCPFGKETLEMFGKLEAKGRAEICTTNY